MANHTGVLRSKEFKDWHGVKLYSFTLEGQDRWFKTGKAEIQAEIGEKISFVERNGKVQLDTVSTQTVTEATTTPTPAEATPSGATSVMEATSISDRIRWQNARADAARVIVAAMHTDCLPHPNNVAKGKRLDLVVGYINELTRTFIEEEESNV